VGWRYLVMIAIIVWLSFDGTFRGAVGERRWGDRDSVIAETSCCRVPTILAPDQAVGISHRVMAVAVQGAPRDTRSVEETRASRGQRDQRTGLQIRVPDTSDSRDIRNC
jgi:hypothetical protein